MIGGYTVAVARVGQRVYLFDSHGYAPVSSHAFCAAFSLAQLHELQRAIEEMMAARMREHEVVGFTTFTRFG